VTPVLAHGTAIVVGGTGLLFVGPSGSGKSSLALQTLFSARLAGHFAALVSDDQVLLEAGESGVSVSCPPALRGLIELRGSGIGRVRHVDKAMLHRVVRLVEVNAANRIPEEGEIWTAGAGIALPQVSMDRLVRDPFPWLEALLPGFPGEGGSEPRQAFTDDGAFLT
jgi:serine kinase of HPr protein (carbohydrate metabolism regulator)